MPAVRLELFIIISPTLPSNIEIYLKASHKIQNMSVEQTLSVCMENLT